MAVYVDPAVFPYRGSLYGHMWADTEEELHRFAQRIGLRREWFQKPPKASWRHYDISKNKRYLAIRYGAVQTDKYGPAYYIAKKENNKAMLDRIDEIRANRNGP